MSDTTLPIRLDDGGHRYVAVVDGHEAELIFRRDGDRLSIEHTEVPDALEGRGLGGALVRAAVAEAIDKQLTIVPQCLFARSWIERHPDEAGAVSVDWDG